MSDHYVKATLVMQEKVYLSAEKLNPLLDIDLKVRIGINTGKVIVEDPDNKTSIETP